MICSMFLLFEIIVEIMPSAPVASLRFNHPGQMKMNVQLQLRQERCIFRAKSCGRVQNGGFRVRRNWLLEEQWPEGGTVTTQQANAQHETEYAIFQNAKFEVKQIKLHSNICLRFIVGCFVFNISK
jgi:hypothetical protein